MKAKKIVFVKLTPILLAFIGVTNAHGPSTKKISLCQCVFDRKKQLF